MPRKPNGFRINRKKVGLTYSCPKDAAMHPISAHKELRDFMQSKGYCKYHIWHSIGSSPAMGNLLVCWGEHQANQRSGRLRYL